MKAKCLQYLSANVLVGGGGSTQNCPDAAMATAFHLHLLFRRTVSSPEGVTVKLTFGLLTGRPKAGVKKSSCRASTREKNKKIKKTLFLHLSPYFVNVCSITKSHHSELFCKLFVQNTNRVGVFRNYMSN